MLQKFKRLFSKKSQKSQERESILPRNRFADLDFERVLKSGTRCCVDEDGHYVEDGKITLFEFSIDFAEFEFIGDFKIEEEDQFKQLLARLNSFDNAIQSHLESELQQPIPQFAKNLGYTQKRWEKTFYFHPWIFSFDENPPNLRYVADYVNDEFTVYFAKRHRLKYQRQDNDLRKKLLDLFTNVPGKIGKNKLTEASISSIVQKLYDSRNYYIHGDEKSKYKNLVTDFNEMYDLRTLCQEVLRFYIFQELGLEYDEEY